MPQAVTEKPDNSTMQQPKPKTATPTVAANETTVSANLVDLGGTAWAGALITINFQPAPNIPGPYFWGGGLFSLRPQLTADSSGHFSISLPDNTTITPAGSTWQFVIAPNATMPAVIFNLMIAGAAMDISSVFTAQSYQVSLGIIQSLPLPRSYQDSDVATPANSGQIYYNTANQAIMVWDNNTWSPLASGAGKILPNGSDPDYFNTFGSGGIYQGTYGIPDPTLNEWTFLTIPGGAGISGRIQIASSYNDPQFRIWIRASFGQAVPPDWSPWRIIPPLRIEGETDLNTLTTTGTYILAGATNVPNPVQNSYGAIVEVWTPGFPFDGYTTNYTQRLSLPNTGWPVPELYYRLGVAYEPDPAISWGPWFGIAMAQVS